MLTRTFVRRFRRFEAERCHTHAPTSQSLRRTATYIATPGLLMLAAACAQPSALDDKPHGADDSESEPIGAIIEVGRVRPISAHVSNIERLALVQLLAPKVASAPKDDPTTPGE